jgi:hypothetical protein
MVGATALCRKGGALCVEQSASTKSATLSFCVERSGSAESIGAVYLFGVFVCHCALAKRHAQNPSMPFTTLSFK